MKHSSKLITLVLVAVLYSLSSITSATVAKRALTHNDFDAWRTIATPVVSRDGKWLAYSVQPQDGDGELVLRDVTSNADYRVAVGALPPPVTTPNEENPDAPPVPRAIRVLFTSDNRYLVASTFPTKADIAAARKAKTRVEDMPKGGLLMIDLARPNDAVRVSNIKSLQVPSKGGAWLAYLAEEVKALVKPTGASATSATNEPAKTDVEHDEDQAARRPASASTASVTGSTTAPRKEFGTELTLRNLSNNNERRFANVLEYSLSRDGKLLLYTVASKAETDNGVYLVAIDDAASIPTALITGKGKYVKLTWDREQTQAALMSDRDDIALNAATKQPKFKLYRWSRADTIAVAAEIRLDAANGAPTNMQLSDKGSLAFSRDGKKLYVPLAPPPKPPRDEDLAPPAEERVVADLWRWNDDYVQPIQKVRAVQERNRTYRGVWDIVSKRYTQLADETMRSVSMSDDGTRAIGADDRAYRRLSDFDGVYTDLYVVDSTTGKRTLALKKMQGNGQIAATQFSPDGKWLIYFQDKHWHLLNTLDGTKRNLSGSAKVAFHNEEQDTPGVKSPYGAGGWLSDSSSVLLYDRFDIWQFFVDNKPPQNLTRALGKQTKIRLRLQSIEPVDIDDDERGINPLKPLILRGESEETRATGFYTTSFTGADKPTRLIWGDSNHRYIGRSLDADVIVMSTSRFDQFPELQLTNSRFAQPRVITNVGAQKDAFSWGTSELMAFRNAKGVPLKATLYKPENFDAKKKYPLMVYIYERLSQNVHNFSNPAPSNGINPALYVSNGYVILMPDIAYTVGVPGKDALDAVMPAIDTLVKQGFIDEKAIGIQGHSWGGYQIAWMVTQTNRFRAAEAGAPVGNMTSAYSGIRWGSGVPRQFQYEQGQSRIAKSLQEAAPLYIAASPVFHAKKIATPLLILANDADDAVPWYQGIELFLALRRYNKEAYLFNYNGQLHNLRRRADQKDFALRMHQYFDHFLKGAAAPEWMIKGVTFNDREEEKERFGKLRMEGVEVKPQLEIKSANPL
jgi:dipeptidyl aminopeptidase/acylaminoacyl peptidase